VKTPLQLGPLPIGPVPRVVGVVSTPLTLDRIAGGFRPVCDVVEFRADLFGVDAPDWLVRAQELERDGLPVLLTLRHADEGGHWYRSEEERLTVYRQTLPFLSAVDVEVRSPACAELARLAREAGRLAIGSFHDFAGTPDPVALREVLARGAAAGVNIVKIAAVTRNEEDLARLEALLARPACPLALLGMGPLGPVSRVRLALAGSCLTYGFVDEANAPGQLSSAELVARLAAASPAYAASRSARGLDH
jgi:3-dehydroquinate dehydratase-1